MSSPGQNIEDMISRMSIDDISILIGEDIVTTLKYTYPAEAIASALRRVALEFFHMRPEQLFGKHSIRQICYNAMTVEKLAELAARLGLDNRRQLEGYDPSKDSVVWQRYLGFFGIDAHATSPVRVDLGAISSEPRSSMPMLRARSALILAPKILRRPLVFLTTNGVPLIAYGMLSTGALGVLFSTCRQALARRAQPCTLSAGS